MKVTIQLFAAAQEAMEASSLELELPQTAAVRDLREAIQRQAPALRTLLPHCMIAVDAEYANDDTPLSETSEIAVIPPVSGG